MKIKNIIVLLCFLMLCGTLYAQDWQNFSDEEIFHKARILAFDHQEKQAQELLHFILNRTPDYHDARILLARTYAWKKNYVQSRNEIDYIMKRNPAHQEALELLIDVDMWDHQYNNALVQIENYYKHFSYNDDVQYKKALVYYELKDYKQSKATLSEILKRNPAHEKSNVLLLQIEDDLLKYDAGFSYSINFFSKIFDPAHLASAYLSRKNSWGSAIARVNFANRFKENGVQGEIDLYPRFAKRIYAYLNYGYSNSALFPEHRIGAELYSSISKRGEASFGIRYLDFSRDSKVTIYTGSLGYYVGNCWISLRPFIIPTEGNRNTLSALFMLRKYYADQQNYIGLTFGGGFSPDERRLQTSSGLTSSEIFVLSSQSAGLSFSKTLRGNYTFMANVDLTRQELIFDQDNFVYITGIGFTLKRKF